MPKMALSLYCFNLQKLYEAFWKVQGRPKLFYYITSDAAP